MSTALSEKPDAETLPQSSAASIIINGHYAPPPKDEDGKSWVRTSALIQRDAQELYELWSDLESVPAWQEQVVSVVRTGPTTSRWTLKPDATTEKPGDKTITWDAETLADEPGSRIAWRTIGGDVQQAGEVIFEKAPSGGGTVVTLLQQLGVGRLASVVATVTGRNPKQAVVENLRHFKALAETGEIPRTQKDPMVSAELSAG